MVGLLVDMSVLKRLQLLVEGSILFFLITFLSVLCIHFLFHQIMNRIYNINCVKKLMAKVNFIVSIENYDEYEDKYLLNR